MSTKTAKSRSFVNPQWKSASRPEEVFYTTDQIIDAYEKGKIDGMSIYSETLKNTLSGNLEKVMPELEKFYKSIPKNSSDFMALQIAGINYFQVLVALDKDVFLDKEKSRPIYESAFSVCDKHKSLHISFIPCADSNSINIESLVADEYLFIYGKQL